MANEANIDVGQELLNVPMGEMIRSMALAIADAQWELDKSSMVVAELMSGQRLRRNLDTGEVDYEGGKSVIDDTRVYFGYNYELHEETTGEGDDATTTRAFKRLPKKVSMMELGFTPTFYQFVDTIIEVRIAVSMSGSSSTEKSENEQSNTYSRSLTRDYSSDSSYTGGWSGSNVYSRQGTYHRRSTKTRKYGVSVANVDARYANTYNYSVDGSSLLRTKLAPVPPPGILLERIRQVMDEEKAFTDWRSAKKGTITELGHHEDFPE